MDTEIEKKFQKIKELAEYSSNKIGDLTFYSSGFLKNIIFELDNSTDYFKDPHVLIYGDFNGLADINNNFGRKEGTRCMSNALEIMHSILPKGVDCCRVGGDEFLFLFPLSNAAVSPEKYMQKINDILSTSDSCRGLSIELSSGISKNSHNLSESFQNLQKDVEDKKIKHILLDYEKKYNNDNWKVLKAITQDSFQRFFKTFRFPENYNIGIRRSLKRNKQYINQFKNVLSSFDLETSEDIPLSDTLDNIDLSNSFRAPAHQIAALFNILTNKDINFEKKAEDLELLDMDLLNQLINSWSRDTLTELFNKNHLESFLLPLLDTSNNNYRGAYLSLSGIKLYNDTIGHDATDEEIAMSSSLLKPLLTKSLLKSFMDDPVCTKEEANKNSHLIYLGGGDFVCFVKNDISIEKSDNDENIKEDPLFKKLFPAMKIFNRRSHLPIAYIPFDIPKDLSKESLENLLNSSQKLCNKEKVAIKRKLVTDPHSEKLLNSIYNHIINSYYDLIEDSNSPESKAKLKDLISSTAMHEISKYTPWNEMRYYDEPCNENLSEEENMEAKKLKDEKLKLSKTMQKKLENRNDDDTR